MNTSRKKHSATFKEQVAIEAIKDQETFNELAKYIHSYKLIGLDITHSNQVWRIDIGYIYQI